MRRREKTNIKITTDAEKSTASTAVSEPVDEPHTASEEDAPKKKTNIDNCPIVRREAKPRSWRNSLSRNQGASWMSRKFEQGEARIMELVSMTTSV